MDPSLVPQIPCPGLLTSLLSKHGIFAFRNTFFTRTFLEYCLNSAYMFRLLPLKSISFCKIRHFTRITIFVVCFGPHMEAGFSLDFHSRITSEDSGIGNQTQFGCGQGKCPTYFTITLTPRLAVLISRKPVAPVSRKGNEYKTG